MIQGVKVHVHVYRVIEKAEIDFEFKPSDDPTVDVVRTAMDHALYRARIGTLEFEKMDCQFLAIPMVVDGNIQAKEG